MLALLTGWRGYVLLAALVGVSATWSVWTIQGWRYDAQVAAIQRDGARAAAQAQELYRAKERDRVAAAVASLDDAHRQTVTAQADADSARTASDKLRTELDALKRRVAARNTAAPGAGQGESGADTLDLLINLLSGLDADGRAVSQYADRLRVAGLACEGIYDSLNEANHGR